MITISWPVRVYDLQGKEIKAAQRIQPLDGLVYLENWRKGIPKSWKQRGIEQITVRFVLNPASAVLCVVIELAASAKLDEKQLAALCNEAQIEGTDGLLEGVGVQFDDGSEVTIDCSPLDVPAQAIRVQQTAEPANQN